MALDQQDRDAIAAIVDERLAQRDARERRRRRLWFLFWLVFFILSTLLTWHASIAMLQQVLHASGSISG